MEALPSCLLKDRNAFLCITSYGNKGNLSSLLGVPEPKRTSTSSVYSGFQKYCCNLHEMVKVLIFNCMSAGMLCKSDLN